MQLYFLRHAEALPDGERPLTEDGVKQSKRVGKALRKLGVTVCAIYTSPLARASQTADHVGSALGIRPQVTDLLASGADLADLRELLDRHGPEDVVMLVGHEPDFSTMIGQLMGAGNVDMKKAGIALVDCAEIAAGRGLLKWLSPPKFIRG